MAFVEEAARRAVRSASAPARRADTEEELLAHPEVPLAARARLPRVAKVRRQNEPVAWIAGAERQRLPLHSVVDLGVAGEGVLHLAADVGDEDVALSGAQEKSEPDGERVLRVGRSAAEVELVARREVQARLQVAGLVRGEPAGDSELLRMGEAGQAGLTVDGHVQVVLTEEVELDARHGLAESVGPRAVQQHVVVVPRHQRHAGPPLDVDLRARPPGGEEGGEGHEQREPGRGHHHRSYGTTTVSPGPSVTLLLPVTRSS